MGIAKVHRILIADDDADMRAAVRDLLRHLHAEVDEAASGYELIAALADGEPYDLVVTDVCMPWMTGLQGLITARHAGIRTPFIVMTAFPGRRAAEIAAGLGDSVFLPKPFAPRVLRETVHSLLGLSAEACERLWQ